MYDPILSEMDLVAAYSVFAVIPAYWALVRFFAGVLPRPGGQK